MDGLSGGVRWGSSTRVVALAGVLLLAACNGGGGSTADQTLPPADTTTSSTAASTTSTTVDYTVPAVIDAAYVEKVMQALDHVYGNAVRHIVQVRSMDDEFLKHLVAIYTPGEFQLQQDVWARELRTGLADRPAVPGDARTTVQRLISASPSCVVAAVEKDFRAALTREPNKLPQHFIGLIPKPPGRDPAGLNPTPWTLSFDGFLEDGSVPEQPCDPS